MQSTCCWQSGCFGTACAGWNAAWPRSSPGVERLAQGQPAHLPETGDFAPAHAALNRASAQLARRDAARAEWIGGISHDVRTPLAVILGYAATLEDDPALPAAARTQAGAIRAQAERLRTLMEDLNLTSKLEYSMQPLRLRYLDPAELARGVVTDFLNAGLPEGFTLDFSAEGPADTMEGDPALLARALENLIRNSIATTPAAVRSRWRWRAGRTAAGLRWRTTASGCRPKRGRRCRPPILGLCTVRQAAQPMASGCGLWPALCGPTAANSN